MANCGACRYASAKEAEESAYFQTNKPHSSRNLPSHAAAEVVIVQARSRDAGMQALRESKVQRSV